MTNNLTCHPAHEGVEELKYQGLKPDNLIQFPFPFAEAQD
jgi:hypothetical protein